MVGRKLVLDEDGDLLGLGQLLRSDGWVYYFLDSHDIREIDEPTAREGAANADLYAPVEGASGDHLDDRDAERWGVPGEGSGRAIAGDVRDIENKAKREGRELTLEEARECARLLQGLREQYELAWEFSFGTLLSPVEVPEGRYRPTVRLGGTGGDFLEIGGTVEGSLNRAEGEGKVPTGTAAAFRREGMPIPFGEAPMVEYREMLRHLLGVAARYVEIEDAYPERANTN